MEDKIIDLININKSFGEAKILDNLNLFVRRNEFVTLLGPSGCGKTTTLRIIAGFETADSGSIMFDNVNIADTPPHKRKLNTVFQKYALFPNMTVEQNIAFGLTIKKVDKKIIKEEVNKMLKLVNLVDYNDRRITELSGGQQQRIAIARALINKPEVLLLDEPLGALDLKLRKEMQIELKNMQKTLGITFIYVTHDQEEALTMSDTIVVMNNGIIQQIGTAEDIYNEPKNAFVADFIGESNIIDGYMDKDYSVTFAGHTFECVDPMFVGHNDIEVVVRPEDIVLIDEKDQGHLNGIVTNAIFKGVHYEMTVEVNHNGTTIPFLVHSITLSHVGTAVSLCIDPVSIHIMKKLNQSNTSNKVEMVTE